jgi:hypothetical protein
MDLEARQFLDKSYEDENLKGRHDGISRNVQITTLSDHYHLSLIWMYLDIFYCLDTSILETGSSGRRKYIYFNMKKFVMPILIYIYI